MYDYDHAEMYGHVGAPKSSTPRRRSFICIVFLAVAVPILACLGAAGSEAATNGPIRIRIDPPVASGTQARFVVHVLASGSAILLVPGDRPRSATLEVNGVVRQAAGSAVMLGVQPLGKSIVNLLLTDVTPTDAIFVRVEGGDGTLQAVDDLALLTTATRSSLLSGMYFAFFLCMALFASAKWWQTRDWNSVWYVLWVLGTVLMKASLDGFLGSTNTGMASAAVSILLIQCGMTAFAVTYLGLRREAPKLFWCVVGIAVVAAGIPPIITRIGLHGLDLLAPLVGMAPLFPAAIIRLRQGFKPAGLLLIALGTQYLTFVLQFTVAQSATPSPLRSDGWILASAAFSFALFGFAAATRQRYVMRHNETLAAELRRSEFEASHDPLTGLLNRRGLDAWVSRAAGTVSTVFFIDLDEFKAVNDLGGHAAGDAALQSVSHIIRASVRECDAVARVGGDEFVVAFVGEPFDAVLRVRERIRVEIGALRPLGPNDPTRIGASIGIGLTSGTLGSIEDALKAADADAYRIKLDQRAPRQVTAG